MVTSPPLNGKVVRSNPTMIRAGSSRRASNFQTMKIAKKLRVYLNQGNSSCSRRGAGELKFCFSPLWIKRLILIVMFFKILLIFYN